MELTRLKVKGTGVTNLTTLPVSSVLHDLLEVKTDYDVSATAMHTKHMSGIMA